MAETDPFWFKDAIIYEVHVRAFFDSVGDGHGDFAGLTQKLDYLRDLGITAIWLLPFYPSPLKDDGYDIADYTTINPQFGRLDDFKALLEAAHERGLRVITELVLNHTSDQHPWFQRARRAPKGSPDRDFYVWSDSPDKYQGVRVIFQDFEPSNWSWDPVAKAYYWHRFYSHQPDLNFDNPAVWEALFPLVDYWLEMGVDGLRLDAIPYLYEREGTNCENLAETHDFLKALRRHVDERFPGRMFLAEANQWPEDSVAYFGDGDECHMAFHFPLMPRLFMALHQEDRFPITDIMLQTPPIPENCQWCLFLRNHDELTLEMVTDEERDYMYRAYTRDRQARINLGIRHRLAPLLSNDRRRIELMFGLLFSMPGTPVIYYGDEIGMGDNIYLGDRNGVRTPMQWSADRNAGFSRANPQRLYLPVVIDPEYHYETVNVEAQQGNPASLLWWIKRLIHHRKGLASMGRGTFRLLRPENPKVLAFVREHESERVLVVANLSRFVQYVQLDLKDYAGSVPEEVLGRTRFPGITDQPYPLTIGPHGFIWFVLPPVETAGETAAESRGGAEPVLPLLKGADLSRALQRPSFRQQIETLLPGLLDRRFGTAPGRRVATCRIAQAVPIRLGEREDWFLIVDAEFDDLERETFALSLAFVPETEQGDLLVPAPSAALGRIEGPEPGVICDAIAVPGAARGLLRAILAGRSRRAAEGEIVAGPLTGRGPTDPADALDGLVPSVMQGTHGNSLVLYGEAYVLKLFSRLQEGVNPALEIGRYLAARGDDLAVAPVVGAIEYRGRGGEPSTLGILRRFVDQQATAWQFTLDHLSQYFERVAALPRDASPPALPTGEPSPPADAEAGSTAVHELIGNYLESAGLLGRRLAEIHAALAQGSDDALAPVAFTKLYQRSLYQSVRTLTGRLCRRLRHEVHAVPEPARPLVERVLAAEGSILQVFRTILDPALASQRIRCHGDYHLGHLLHTGKDFVLTDFEGDASRPIGERRIKRSPLRDVASLLRSLDYAVHTVLHGLTDVRGRPPGVVRVEDRPALEPWAHFWYDHVRDAVVGAYLDVIGPAALLPETPEATRDLLESFLLEKALLQVDAELTERPGWVEIPLHGVLRLLGEDETAGTPP